MVTAEEVMKFIGDNGGMMPAEISKLTDKLTAYQTLDSRRSNAVVLSYGILASIPPNVRRSWVAAARADEWNRIEQYIYNDFLPRRDGLFLRAGTVEQAIARIDEVIRISKGMRLEVVSQTLSELTDDLVLAGNRFNTFAEQVGAIESAISDNTAMVASVQEAVSLMRKGDKEQSLKKLEEVAYRQGQIESPILALDYGGRSQGPGPVQAYLLQEVGALWHDPEAHRSFEQSVNLLWGTLRQEYQQRGKRKMDPLRYEAFIKLGKVQSVADYVADLHKKYPGTAESRQK